MPKRMLSGGVVVLAALALWMTLSGSSTQVFRWTLPDWVPVPRVPPDNPMTYDKVELGRHLFYDKRLSADQTMSCASCHLQEKAFTDGLPVAKGITGEQGQRSAMALANVAYLPTLTWGNPQIKSLEFQALVPLFGEHPVEMGMAGKEQLLFDRLKGDPQYQRLFKRAFPDEAKQGAAYLYSLSTLTKAIASFQRSLLSFDSPYDRYKYGGNGKAISEAAKRGEALFFGEKLECYHCHGGFNFNDNVQHSRLPHAEFGFHNTGLYNKDGKGAYPTGHEGIAEFTGDAADMGKFRTPTLRNIALTAPYMHDGSIATLKEVLQKHYAKAGLATASGKGSNPLRSELIAGFEISEDETQDVLAFLHSLTDSTFITNPKLSDPWKKP